MSMSRVCLKNAIQDTLTELETKLSKLELRLTSLENYIDDKTVMSLIENSEFKRYLAG